ncbi:RnfH family protein [Lysobacter sp. CA199]|uniref:RnfH family protein n=1 Tax=Lysobacter sp. CA199 TaxID=3455608 RepID=UPI003F8D1D3F
MKIEVVRAWPHRFDAVVLELDETATVAQAVAAAGFQDDPQITGYAVFGLRVSADTRLCEGDRVELLRPLQADPKDARRRRAEDRPLKKK